jgi:hypothetical protein
LKVTEDCCEKQLAHNLFKVQVLMANHGGYVPGKERRSWQQQGLVGNSGFEDPWSLLTVMET